LPVVADCAVPGTYVIQRQIWFACLVTGVEKELKVAKTLIQNNMQKRSRRSVAGGILTKGPIIKRAILT
jgi:hypothetical protein